MCPYKDLEKYKEYQREYKKKWYWEHHEEALEHCRKYREKHVDQTRQYQRDSGRKTRSAWRKNPCESYREQKELGTKVENFAKAEALPALGFENILDLNAVSKMFPYDFVATKEGKDAFVEVTCDIVKKTSKRKLLSKRLNMDLYVLFVKPDLSKYYLKKVYLFNDQSTVSLTNDVVGRLLR